VRTTNLQNCPADGLILRGNGYTVTVLGTITGAPNTNGDNAGISMQTATNVTVRRGGVTGFDAGVEIVGGSGNTVQSMSLTDNVNTVPVGGPRSVCDLGDGLVMFNSNGNQVLNNTVLRNGPFSGISMVENSDNNVVKSNTASDNTVDGPCAGGLNSGVRIEGPGAAFNRVDANTIERNSSFGVAQFENIAGPVSSTTPACQLATPQQPPNTDNFITNNNIRQTGGSGDGDGIGGPAAGLGGACAAVRATITGNTVAVNQGYGIHLAATTHDNIVNSNAVTSNGLDGIRLDGAIFSNTFTNVGPTVFQEVTPTPTTYVTPADYVVLSGSGSGNVTARLVPVGPLNVGGAPGTVPFDSVTSGCSPGDFAGFPAGAVALIQRGNCGRAQKVANAVAAGASGVVMFNEGSNGRTGVLTAGVDPTTIPVLGTSYAIGQALYNQTQAGPVTVHIETHTTNVPSQIGTGAVNNTLNANRGTANADHDGHDANPNCDNNIWTANIFGTVNQPCVKNGGGTGTVKLPMEP